MKYDVHLLKRMGWQRTQTQEGFYVAAPGMKIDFTRGCDDAMIFCFLADNGFMGWTCKYAHGIMCKDGIYREYW